MKCDGAQDACQQIADIARKYDEALNKRDAAAIAALYTPDAVLVTEGPTLQGPDAIEKSLAGAFKAGVIGKHATEIDQVHVQGNLAWAIGSWSDTGPSNGSHPMHGNWGGVIVPEGGNWKIRMLTVNTIETPPGQPAAGQR